MTATSAGPAGAPPQLAIFDDARCTELNARLLTLVTEVAPGTHPGTRARTGCVVISSSWTHWPCLFPQHGPGRKHERAIVLEAWQRVVVEQHPARRAEVVTRGP